MADRSLESMSLPLEVRARLAELELELSEAKRHYLITAKVENLTGVLMTGLQEPNLLFCGQNMCGDQCSL